MLRRRNVPWAPVLVATALTVAAVLASTKAPAAPLAPDATLPQKLRAVEGVEFFCFQVESIRKVAHKILEGSSIEDALAAVNQGKELPLCGFLAFLAKDPVLLDSISKGGHRLRIIQYRMLEVGSPSQEGKTQNVSEENVLMYTLGEVP